MFEELNNLYNKFQQAKPLSPKTQKRLSDNFMMRYIYNSNALEGNTLTFKETSLVLKDGFTVSGKPPEHHLETIGHKDAYYYTERLAKNKIPLSEKVIMDIHSLIFINRKRDKGVYRRKNPIVADKFIPRQPLCQPFEVPVQMERLMLDYNGEMQKLHVVERAAVFHLRFENIYPFTEGNGRVGRLLLNFELMKEGYPPINIKFTDKEKYFNCFNLYNSNKDTSKMTSLIKKYTVSELKTYIKKFDN